MVSLILGLDNGKAFECAEDSQKNGSKATLLFHELLQNAKHFTN
ncbi:MAG: hypothetical protein QF676_01290 [Dehalococcoidia bacterium]|nr:hypothetical protein [Dehalococcoidia bacterium]